MSSTPFPLTAAQENLVHLPTAGQFLVRGATGSGKSVVALARALHLARQPLLHGAPRVLLLARTDALAAALARGRDAVAAEVAARDVAARLDVLSPAAWSAGFLAEEGAPAPTLSAGEFAALVDEALRLVRRRQTRRVLRRPPAFFVGEIESMLLALGIERFEDYGAIGREGRGSPLDAPSRRAVWSVFTTFQALARAGGRTAPLAQVAAALARLRRERARPYNHVVVDDANLFAPVELKLVRALSAGGSLTLLGALEERFDPRAAPMRELGLDRLDRTEVLPLVLRGPAPLFGAALALLRGGRGGASADVRAIDPGTRDGPRPRLVLADGFEHEVAGLLAEIARCRAEGRRWSDLAVLATRTVLLEIVAACLARAAVPIVRLDDGADPAAIDAVRLCPLHCAHGRQFPVVLVLDVNRGTFPPPREELLLQERATADDAARRLLYLAMTRATAELVLFATEATRSRLLPVRKLAVERVARELGVTA